MAFLRNKWAICAFLFASWAMTTTFLAGYYWLQYSSALQITSGILIQVNVGVDYGNGNRTWNNGTKTLTGVTLFDISKQVFNLTYSVGIYGTEVTSINNVQKQGSYAWTYWTWNNTRLEWSIVWENADSYRVNDGETIIWYYENAFDPPP